MSDIDAISNELRALAAGLAKAQTDAAGADHRAHEIAARAARSGFAGIAAGVSRIRDAIREIQARLSAASRSVSEATALVTAAPKEMSPQQTITVLTPTTEKIVAARDGIAATIAKVDEAQRITAAALQGGQPGPMLAALAAIKQLLIQITQRCDAANQHVGAVIAAAGQVGNQGN